MENYNTQQLFPTTPHFPPQKGNVILPQEGRVPHCHLLTLVVKCLVWKNNLDPPTRLQALPLTAVMKKIRPVLAETRAEVQVCVRR